MKYSGVAVALLASLVIQSAEAFSRLSNRMPVRCQRFTESKTLVFGWLDAFLPPTYDEGAEAERRCQYPEQYPATYELSDIVIKSDLSDAQVARPLLKQTQLESRPLQVAYDANKHGGSPNEFHTRVDGKGAAFVIAENESGEVVGGYNPKGWSGYGGARPSVAAFLFYKNEKGEFQKLQKVGGGGLACARDDGDFGICLGADGLVIGLQAGPKQKFASSKLGPYFERGPEDLSSLFEKSATRLKSLKVLVGTYVKGEDIPYSGAVLDMTSG